MNADIFLHQRKIRTSYLLKKFKNLKRNETYHIDIFGNLYGIHSKDGRWLMPIILEKNQEIKHIINQPIIESLAFLISKNFKRKSKSSQTSQSKTL